MDNAMIGFGLSLFVTIALVVAGGLQWWNLRHSKHARRVNRRIRLATSGAADANGSTSILKQRTMSASAGLARLLARIPGAVGLDGFLLQAGVSWTVAQFIGLSLAAAATVMCACLLSGLLPILAVVVGVIGGILPFVAVQRLRTQRLRKLEAQLPDAADLIGRALRAGHSMTSAFSMAAEELPNPIADEFRAVFEEITFGISMNDALTGLAERMPINDLRYLVVAILIQRESGGNLAEILDNVSQIIRERLKLLDKVRVLSAEGRLSAWILSLLPLVLAGSMFLLNPKFMQLLWTDPRGFTVLCYAAGMLVLGIFWMRQVVRIHI